MKSRQLCTAAVLALCSATAAFAQTSQGSMTAPAPMPSGAANAATAPGVMPPDTMPGQQGRSTPGAQNMNDMDRAPASSMETPTSGSSGYNAAGASGTGTMSGASQAMGRSGMGADRMDGMGMDSRLNASNTHATLQVGAQDTQLYRGN